MGVGFLNIGVTAIGAAQIGLATTEHNIAAANTPGYHRQTISQGNNFPFATGAGFIGQGVHVSTVQRVFNQYLENQVLSAQTQASHYSSYYQQISQIDNMLADPNSGLSPALQDFFAGIHEVAAYPASVPGRQSMISSADAMVARFQRLYERFQEIRTGVNSLIASSTGVINSYGQQIAELNERIVIAEAGANNQPANDLLDQRDQLIAELNKEIRATVVKQDDGSYNVFIGKGQALVVGDTAFTLTTQPSPDDPERMDVAYVANNSVVPLSSKLLEGGALGGLLAFRTDSLDQAQNALGRVAIGLAQTFNEQHQLGMDLNGDLGGYFFNVRGPTGATGQFADPSGKVIANINNTGTSPAVTLTDVGELTTSDYTLAYDGANYTLKREQDSLFWDGTQWSATSSPLAPAAFPLVVDGMTITAPVGASANNKWLIQPTRDGARDISLVSRDPEKIAAAAPIATAVDSANTGTATISVGVVVDTGNSAFTTLAHVLTPPVMVQFDDATHYSVYDNTNPLAPVLLEGPILYDPAANNEVFPTPGAIDYGYRISLTGPADTNDKFTVDYNTFGVSDNRNVLLLAALATKNTLEGNSTTYQGAYSQMVSQVGNKTKEVDVTAKAQETLLTQTTQKQQELSGVNLDEEAANLIRYQQAYQAASKMISIASQLFNTLLDAAG